MSIKSCVRRKLSNWKWMIGGGAAATALFLALLSNGVSSAMAFAIAASLFGIVIGIIILICYLQN